MPFWTGADALDECGEARVELYNLDVVAYESLFVGLFEMLKGPPNEYGEARNEPKLTELVLGTSRDGFHWHRCRGGRYGCTSSWIVANSTPSGSRRQPTVPAVAIWQPGRRGAVAIGIFKFKFDNLQPAREMVE